MRRDGITFRNEHQPLKVHRKSQVCLTILKFFTIKGKERERAWGAHFYGNEGTLMFVH